MAGVWVFGENHAQSLELLNIGRRVASELDTKLTCLVLSEPDTPAQDYIDYGADVVLQLPGIAANQTLISYVPVIVDEARSEDPDVFLLAGTLRTKELAAFIASQLDTGLCSDCMAIKVEGKTLLMERLVYGGAGIQEVTCPTRPQMATIPVRTYELPEKLEARQGQVRELPAPPASPLLVLEKKPQAKGSTDIREAQVVVAVGRGMEKQADLEMMRELAELLGGEIGCTRPISEELHWLPDNLCIGISALDVKPQLYLGVGISGQIQHVVGIKDARVICAINNDENAPIFEVSNYGIVGDLYQVVPRLIAELKK